MNERTAIGTLLVAIAVCVMNALFCWDARTKAIQSQENTAAAIRAMNDKLGETLEEKVRLRKQIGHLEYLNRKFAKAEKQSK